MGHGNNRETYFQVSPKKEGLLLLNEYGRKLVDEARKHDFRTRTHFEKDNHLSIWRTISKFYTGTNVFPIETPPNAS